MLSTLLLFNAYTDHNSQASPTPWAGKTLSDVAEAKYHNKSEMQLLRENQLVLIHYCQRLRMDVGMKFFASGWSIGKLDSIWASSLRYYKQVENGDIVTSHPSFFMDEKMKRVESMWIHHFVILQLFHPKFRNHDLAYKNDNLFNFMKEMTPDDVKVYLTKLKKKPKFNYLWANISMWNSD